MHRRLEIILVVISIAVFIIFLCVIVKRIRNRKKRNVLPDGINLDRAQSLQNGIAKLHQVSIQNIDQENSRNKSNYYVFRRGVSSKPVFNWSDHPSLVTEAVENGWSRFAFLPCNDISSSSSSSIRSAKTFLSSCGGGDQAREMEVETSWEVCQGSVDFMQKIRLNHGCKKPAMINVIKAALPLPGPPLGNSSFPNEAYFEITILSPDEDDGRESNGKLNEDRKVEGEKIKLIKEDFNAKSMSESLIHVTSSNGNYGNMMMKNNVELKRPGKDDGKIDQAVVLSVGLTGGGFHPLKIPGSFPGSIGFNSNGSVFLDGTKLISESEKQSWGKPENVIGCGYNPTQKKVFFTIDSHLVHEIHCKSETYTTPLYPTISSNSDTTFLVNLGQCVFKYPPANSQRTSNPCFIGPIVNNNNNNNSPALLGYDDSKELFSMGRIDSQWLNRSSTTTRSVIRAGVDYDEESEGDLFEIVLDSSSAGRSPYTTLSAEQLRVVSE